MPLDSRKQSPLNKPAGIRLQKYLAECGVGSRRACEVLISSGAVTLDGVPVEGTGIRVLPEEQQVCVHGRPVRPQSMVYLLLNKPTEVLCTSSDERGRKTIHALLPDLGVRIYNVGRLDRQSEGLLLVTNDGDLSARLMHPRYHVSKEYRVWTTEPLSDEQMQAFRGGINCQGEMLRMTDIQLDHVMKDTYCYALVLHEGKNRQIRRMFSAYGLSVLRLLRVAIGPIRLGTLEAGAWRHMTPEEVQGLRAEAAAAAVRLQSAGSAEEPVS